MDELQTGSRLQHHADLTDSLWPALATVDSSHTGTARQRVRAWAIATSQSTTNIMVCNVDTLAYLHSTSVGVTDTTPRRRGCLPRLPLRDPLNNVVVGTICSFGTNLCLFLEHQIR